VTLPKNKPENVGQALSAFDRMDMNKSVQSINQSTNQSINQSINQP
jgi:hypothetical protein